MTPAQGFHTLLSQYKYNTVLHIKNHHKTLTVTKKSEGQNIAQDINGVYKKKNLVRFFYQPIINH